MNKCIRIISFTCLLPACGLLSAQDTERPLPPMLDLVSVDPFTGHTSMQWTAGGSPDVAAYIIYLYLNSEGYAIDTLYQPFATSYVNTASNASYYAESYVIAAMDSSDNVSPLSNFLTTIYLEGTLDTCKYNIKLLWNNYPGVSPEVTEYRIASSSNGSAYITEGMTGDNDTTYTLEDFESYSEYCFYIEASLSDGSSSLSNKLCLRTDLPVPPEWINADYATYSDDGSVMLSFTIDPATEYDRYRIERSNNISSGFEIIHNEYTTGNRIEYTDNDPPEGINYYYLAALNNCNEAIVYSNAASTIKLDILSDNKLIMIRWNSYYEWRGGVSSYRITRNNRGYFEEIATISGSDTVYTDNLNDFLYESSQEDICYRVLAEEGFNSYVSSASSHSDIVCIEQPARIFVPNAFTPGGNSINSVFMPVLSFTPVNFRMIIKNRSGLTLFESKDHLLGWDGTYGGRKMPEDVYIWFLETETPGARTIKRNGTIAVIYNQDHP